MGKHFTLDELARSDSARRHNIDNTPGPEETRRLETLIDSLLDPLRQAWGSPITVTSGFRCPELNRLVGGAPLSQHLRGEAADITAGGREANSRLFALIAKGGFDFDQLIDEHNYSWIHISYRHRGNRRQILHV